MKAAHTEAPIRENRLIIEKSPYLLQHATNPVDWHPWGDAAFEKAERENKPVFLSVGYATCHWCHVMAHESFEDPTVATLLNDTFVCVKVDREERPDVDHIYMEVCQMMTGSGGWPLTVFLTPKKQPFYAATYIPKQGRFGRRGLLDIVPEVKGLWHSERERIFASAESIAQAVKSGSQQVTTSMPNEEAFHLAYKQLAASFDDRYGGFGNGTKFPSPHQLSFLLRYHTRYRSTHALTMVDRTLTAMRNGGIFDHVGFGFHRYATDPKWRVPHFEKMLYDQAQLLIAYTEAFQLTRNPAYKETALNTAAYVLRDMTDPQGGFYSAEDADSEGVEGKYYVWRTDELNAVLGENDAALIADFFNVSAEGNFEDPHTDSTGLNILYIKSADAQPTAGLDFSEERLSSRIEAARASLFNARLKRCPPQKDDKILTDWNGLMIAALAFSGKVLERPDFIEAAHHACEFIERNLTLENGRLMHRFRDGDPRGAGNLDDYAFLGWGILELYEASGKSELLQRAVSLAEDMLRHFSDPNGGALFFTAEDAEVVLKRFKERYDGAVPSGNAVAYRVLQRLSLYTGDQKFQRAADRIASDYTEDLSVRPMMFTQFLVGLDATWALGCDADTCPTGQSK